MRMYNSQSEQMRWFYLKTLFLSRELYSIYRLLWAMFSRFYDNPKTAERFTPRNSHSFNVLWRTLNIYVDAVWVSYVWKKKKWEIVSWLIKYLDEVDYRWYIWPWLTLWLAWHALPSHLLEIRKVKGTQLIFTKVLQVNIAMIEAVAFYYIIINKIKEFWKKRSGLVGYL